MIGDKIIIRPEYFSIAEKIAEQINNAKHSHNAGKIVIGIAGESGSGKSVTAICLQQVLELQNKNTTVLHQDDYFVLPPHTNHTARENNINNIGSQEVNISLLQEHLQQFLNNESQIKKPLIHYQSNTIGNEMIDIQYTQVLIIEGTYVLQLQQLHHRIFMARTYLDTYQQRMERGREQNTDFIEQVLSIEHLLIKKQMQLADMIVLKDYSLQNIL